MSFRSESVPFDPSIYVKKAGDTMTGNLVPNPDNAVDLGGSAARWAHVYGVNFTVGGSITGTTNISATLASAPATQIGYGWTFQAGLGGPANLASPGGDGGAIEFAGAQGGNGSATQLGGNGSPIVINAGMGGNTGGFGAGLNGTIFLGVQNTRAIEFGTLLVPSLDDTLDLGTSGRRVRRLYASVLEMSFGLYATADTRYDASTAAANAPGWMYRHTGGTGGLSTVGAPAGKGGAYTVYAGNGGDSATAQDAGDGGDYLIDAGNGGANTGGGAAGVGGTIQIGTARASAITIGRGGVTTRINGTLRYDNTDVNANNGAVIGQPSIYQGYLVIDVGGTPVKVPYFLN